MNANKHLAILAHTPSENTAAMAQALYDGALSSGTNIHTTLASPFEFDAEQTLQHDALILFTTENFAYMSGALKDYFERIYYPCLAQPERNIAKPVAVVIRAGNDGTGSEIAINRILTGLQWRKVQPTLICKGDFQTQFLQDCTKLSQTIAAGLELDIF